MYNIWEMNDWKYKFRGIEKKRKGLYFRYDKNVDPEVRRACMQFAAWLRKEYQFPIRIVVYVKEMRRITAMDGERVVGTFFEPYCRSAEPYIRAAAGDYEELKADRGRDNALASILHTIAHELSHYYQWINGIELTSMGFETQATRCANLIMNRYSETRDHP